MYFHLKKDIYLASVYISPEHTSGNVPDIDSVYSQLLQDIEVYSKYGDIVIQGDFNAYTSTEPDYIMADEITFANYSDNHYVSDTNLPRNNLDTKHSNNSGKLLLSICRETSLRIINGRMIGDLLGNFTSIHYNGCSVVDYTLVSESLLKSVIHFKVHDFTALSDHCPIVCSIKTAGESHIFTEKVKLDSLPGKFLWNTDSIESYSKNMSHPDIRKRFQDFENKEFTDTDASVEAFNNILLDVAKSSTKYIQNLNMKMKRKKNKPWFNQSCKDMKNILKKYEKLVRKNPSDGAYRHAFYSYRSKFRRLCNYQAKMFNQSVLNDISKNMDSNPKTFWNLLNKLSKSTTKSVGENIQEGKFIDFFTNLNSAETVNNEFQSNVVTQLHALEAQNTQFSSANDDLNKEINTNEIMKAIKSLKNGKSASGDNITNEMLKNGSSVFINALKKLFNYIFDAGKFPSFWNESYIVLIHKKGSKNDPANYRGISLTSCLGKLFNKVINARLLEYVDTKNVLSYNQIGFKQNSRTSDHILTLKSIIDFQKSKKKKVFAAFIDLRKAFDTVWRDGLFYKILLNGINGRVYNIIRSMYTDNICKIKFANGLSKQFPSTCGVKQGDVLSPILFNLFIDDLVKNLNSCPSGAISVNGLSINSLLYADDIVLLANSQEALQTYLDILNDFCTSWKLHINTDKSKVVVFNSDGKQYLDTFKCANSTLETSSSYCHLGVTFKYTGSLTHTSMLLMEKAKKALFKIKIQLDSTTHAIFWKSCLITLLFR